MFWLLGWLIYGLVVGLISKRLHPGEDPVGFLPTIGIGAGDKCDGQVLVIYDMLGLFPDFSPRFARKYMNLKEDVKKAVSDYSRDVKNGSFPGEEETIK